MVVVNPLTHAVDLLVEFGFFQVVLPLILVFALFFGILEKTKIFGEDKTNINAVISFVAAFFVVTSTEVIEAINTLIPQASLLLVVALLVLMLFAFFGVNPQDKFDSMGKWAWLGALILFIIFLGVLDVSLGLKIPVVHEATEAFIGGGEDTVGGIGGTRGTGDITTSFLDSEEFQSMVSVILLFVIPLIVVVYVLKKS